MKFSPKVTGRRPKLQRGKELGEHSVLDVDTITPPVVDSGSEQENTTVATHNPFLSQRSLDAQDAQDVDTTVPLDLSRGLDNCTVSTYNPFRSQSFLDAQEVDLAADNETEIPKQESTQPQVTDGKTFGKPSLNKLGIKLCGTINDR